MPNNEGGGVNETKQGETHGQDADGVDGQPVLLGVAHGCD